MAGAFVADPPGDPYDADGYRPHDGRASPRPAVPRSCSRRGASTGSTRTHWVDAHADARRARSATSSPSSSARCSSPTGASCRSTPTAALLACGRASAPSTRRSRGSSSGTGSRVRDAERPDFLVLTGNDLAIDMVMWGSDYLLGLSTFAPDAFAAPRPACGATATRRSTSSTTCSRSSARFAFRAPVPGYRHDAAMFLHARGWIDHDGIPPGAVAPTRERPARSSSTSPRRHRRLAAREPRRPVPADQEARDDRRPPRRLAELGVDLALDVDDSVRAAGPLSTPFTITDGSAGERTVAQPLRRAARWRAGTAPPTARPTDLVERRWRRFGAGGAEARVGRGDGGRARGTGQPEPAGHVARHRRRHRRAPSDDGRRARRARFGDRRPVVGLQLTHSGRWCRPEGALDAATRGTSTRTSAGRSPGATCSPTTSSRDLVDRYVDAAVLAQRAGFDFVDVKHCHGYLLPRAALGARPARRVRRPLRAPHPLPPRRRRGHPHDGARARRSRCGCRPTTSLRSARATSASGGLEVDGDYPLRVRWRRHRGRHRPHRAARVARPVRATLGIGLVSITAGSPYYTPHIQRPAYFPPSDGYLPPEDPLVGVARLLDATAELQAAHPTSPSSPAACRTCRTGSPTPANGVDRRRRGRLHRPRSHGAVVPGPARRRARRPPARPPPRVPHPQRLHDRAPERAGVGLLPARRLLQGAPREGRAGADQASGEEHVRITLKVILMVRVFGYHSGMPQVGDPPRHRPTNPRPPRRPHANVRSASAIADSRADMRRSTDPSHSSRSAGPSSDTNPDAVSAMTAGTSRVAARTSPGRSSRW